jgi:mannitol-1-phosphate 5-dehydrogenase
MLFSGASEYYKTEKDCFSVMKNSTVKSIVIFGAGKIGRSFIGQLFGRAGYKIIFIDKNHRIIDELNRCKKYKVVIKFYRDEVLEVRNVYGLVN